MNLNKVHVHVLGNVKYEIEKKITPVGMLKDCYGKKERQFWNQEHCKIKGTHVNINSQLHIQEKSYEAQLAL